jgi:hypothetical protein
MSNYIAKLGEELNFVLERACASQPEHFAGYCANVEFWCSEYEHLGALVDGYEDRLAKMKEATNRFLKEDDRKPQNLDEFGEPHQMPEDTSRPSNRARLAQEAERNFRRFLKRGLELECLDPDLHDDIIDRIGPPRERHRAI